MLSLEMLDVAIGMIFMYLLISLICSAANEFVEAKLKLRAVDLEQGIRQMLNDPDGKVLTSKIYNHPLIYSLFKGSYDTSKMRIVKDDPKNNRYSRGSDLPSYIPSRNFALALMDALLPAKANVQSGAEGAIATTAAASSASPITLQPLREAVSGIADEKVKAALLTVIDAAGNDVSKAREGIENWYNSGMDRVSGWYKRRTQQIIFWMGFFIAVAMNADSFAVFTNLVNDRPLRSAVVATALNKSSSAKPEDLQSSVDNVLQLGLPIGWRWKSLLNDDPKARRSLAAIPIFNLKATPVSSLWNWLVKIIGWLITALAVSLGASFWFDTLNKVMVIRSTVKPHEKSPEENSQDNK